MKQLNTLKIIITLLAVFALAITVGCSEQTSSTSAPNTQIEQSANSTANSGDAPAKSSEKQNIGINIYFPDANGEKLSAAKRQINPTRDDRYTAAVQALIDGPTSDKEGIYIMPKDTHILGVTVQDGVATVNFSKEFKTNFSGGSTGELMLIGSIVNTLTEFNDVKSVRFTVEGKALDSLSGHLDLSVPQTRMENLF